MRIILLAAAVISAAAIGTAATARPGGTGSGHGGGQPGTWSSGGGHHSGKGGHARFGFGAIELDRRHGRHHRRFDRREFHPYGGAGIAGPVGEVDPYGNGFFTGGGGRIRLRGGRPYFDYDRGYPYEWASSADARQEWAEEARTAKPPGRCGIENGVRVCRGW
jgi:hypothetical protein